MLSRKEIQMPQISVRLRDHDKQKLNELEAKLGKNTTEVIRDLIQIGYEREAVNKALGEIRVALKNLAAHNLNAEIADIKRIVTLIGRAMPAIARSV